MTKVECQWVFKVEAKGSSDEILLYGTMLPYVSDLNNREVEDVTGLHKATTMVAVFFSKDVYGPSVEVIYVLESVVYIVIISTHVLLVS